MDSDEQRAEQRIKNDGLPANFHTLQDLLDYDIEIMTSKNYKLQFILVLEI